MIINQSITISKAMDTMKHVYPASRLGRFTAVLLTLLVLTVGQVFGAVANISFATKNSTGTATVNGVTVSFSNTSNGQTGYYKVSAGQTFTLTCSANIKTVLITYTAQNYSPSKSGYADGLLTANAGKLIAKASTTTSTWVGSAKSITFADDGTNGKDFRIASIVVTTDASIYYYRGNQNSWGATAMTVSEDGYYEYISAKSYASNGNANNIFKIALSQSGWDYNWSCADKSGFNGTDVTDMWEDSPESDHNVGIYHTTDYYVLVYYPGTAKNAASTPKICASTTLPYDGLTRYVVAGNGTDNWPNGYSWNNGAGNGYTNENDMTYEDGVWTKTYENLPVGYYEFKLCVKGTWDGSIGYSNSFQSCATNTTLVKGSASDKNIGFTTTAAGDVTITYDGTTVCVTAPAAAPAPASEYYIKTNWGGISNWSWRGPLKDNGDGTYSIDGSYGGSGCNWNTSASDDGSRWIASPALVGAPTAPNECTFTLNPTAGTITITKKNYVAPAEKATGLDFSLIGRYETAGTRYYTAPMSNTVIPDVVTWTIDEKNVNYVRVRLFVDPTNDWASAIGTPAQMAGTLAEAKAIGKRVKDAGAKLLLDIHYSDGWADPEHQVMPKRWANICSTYAQLQDSVYQYTKDVLNAMIAAGATPDMVQVGNEITYGMFFNKYEAPAGNAVGNTGNNISYTSTAAGSAGLHCHVALWPNEAAYADSYWNNFTAMLSKGCQAVREVCPSAKIMLHTERSGDSDYKTSNNLYPVEEFYEHVRGVDYDVIGLSYYPEYHGTLTKLNTILTALEARFNSKEIMLAEFGYSNSYYLSDALTPGTIGYYLQGDASNSCPQAQKECIEALFTTLSSHSNVTGVFYWFPEENEGDNEHPGPYSTTWRNTGFWANAGTDHVVKSNTGEGFEYWDGRALLGLDAWGRYDGNIYSITYNMNGGAFNSNFDGRYTYTGKSAVTLATETAIEKTGYTFAGWYEASDFSGSAVTTVGGSGIKRDLTLYAKWEEETPVDECTLYSLSNRVGTAEVTAADATVNGTTSLVLSNTAGRIKITPKAGEVFKNGDKITFSGTVGKSEKNYGIKVYGTDGSTNIGEVYVAGTTSPLATEVTLSGLTSPASYIYIARYDGTTTTLTSCEITRPNCNDPVWKIAGDFNSWTAVELTDNSYYEVDLAKATDYEFKIIKSDGSDTWYTMNGTITKNDCTGKNFETIGGTGNNTTLNTTAAGTYRINVNTEGATPVVSVVYPADYTIRYNGNGETSGSMSDETLIASGEQVTLTANAFVKTGYHFSGWKDQDDNVIADGAQITVTKDLTLTAQWEKEVQSISITADENIMQVGGTLQLSVVYTPEDATYGRAISWTSSNTNYLTVSDAGLVTAVGSGNGFYITATSANGKTDTYNITIEAASCDQWQVHMWNTGGTYARACLTEYDAVNHEWRSGQVVLPSNSDDEKLKVLFNGNAVEHSAQWNTRWLPMVNHRGEQLYPGQDAVGYFRLYSNSTQENYYLGFQPTYVLTYGRDGQGGWLQYDFAWDNDHEFRTEILKVPTNVNELNIYVGTKRNGGTSPYVAGHDGRTDKSENVAMTTIASAEKAGKYGYYMIYDNSGSRNWYLSFVESYAYELRDDDETLIYAGTSTTTSATTLYNGEGTAALPTKPGHILIGWATSKGGDKVYELGDNYTYSSSLDILYPAWQRPYTITYKDQGDLPFSGTGWESPQPTTHTYGTPTTLVNPTKTSSLFMGWYETPDCLGAPITTLGATAVTADKTLYAKWADYCFAMVVKNPASTNKSVNLSVGNDLLSLTGGSVSQSGLDENTKDKGLKYGSGKDYIKVTLANDMQLGNNTRILVSFETSNAAQNGITLGTTSTRPSTIDDSNSILEESVGRYDLEEFVVTKESPLYGATTFYIYRAGGNTTYLTEVYVVDCSPICYDSEPQIVEVSHDTSCRANYVVKAVDESGNDIAGRFQWYKDGVAIPDATSQTYTITEDGSYTVEYTDKCPVLSSNSFDVENLKPAVQKLVPFQYYHADSVYAAGDAHHLFTFNSAEYQLSAIKNVDTPYDIPSEAIYRKAGADGVDTLMLNRSLLNNLSIGDSLTFTATPVDECSNVYPENAASVKVYAIAKATKTLAFILPGANSPTKYKKFFVLDGDFLTGYNKADLYLQNDEATNANQKAGVLCYDPDTELPLYTDLKANFLVTPVNGYAKFNIFNYEPFDVLFLTDFVKSDGSSNAAAAKKHVEDLGLLVDYRPMFSTKGHMSGFNNWKEKGFTANPTVPKQTQVLMNIVCYAHPMFNDVDPDGVNVFYDANDHSETVFKMLSRGGYDGGKGIQGFEINGANEFIKIALTHYDAHGNASGNYMEPVAESDDRTLIASCERQTNIKARFMMLSLNADATCFLTAAGRNVIILSLKYLLETTPAKVTDCHFEFDDNHHTGIWSDPANWGPNYNLLPGKNVDVRIAADCRVDNTSAVAAGVKIKDGVTLTIADNAALTIQGIAQHQNAQGKLTPTTSSDLVVSGSSTGTGAFIHGDNVGQTQATVQMYSKAHSEVVAGKNVKYWQYVGMPVKEADFNTDFYGAYTYEYSEASGWLRVRNGNPNLFVGYGLSQTAATLYNLSGTIASTADRVINLTKTNDGAQGENLIGNSWTAPIQIASFEAADFTNAEATVYVYNTGRDDRNGTDESNNWVGEADSETPGQWISIAVEAAKGGEYVGLKVIPAMQAFEVKATAADAKLTLNYDRLVRSTTAADINTPLRAPRRNMATNNRIAPEEVNMMRIRVADEKTHTDLYLMEHPMFTDEFDNGWDAGFLEGDGRSAMLSAASELGDMAFLAKESVDGTVLNFVAGRESFYTFSFGYSGDKVYYLNDLLLNTSTQIIRGNTYSFVSTEDGVQHRFMISTTPISHVATDIGGPGIQDKAQKVLLDNRLFIIKGGRLYDAVGRLVY